MSEQKKKRWTTFLVWSLLLSAFFLFFLIDRSDEPTAHVDYDTFVADINEGRVAGIRVHNNQITVTPSDGSPSYVTLGVVDDELTQLLSEHGAHVSWGKPKRPLRTILTVAIPLLLLVAFLYYFAKKANNANTGVFALGKSKARKVETTDVTFDDVGGCHEAKALLSDVVDFLQHKDRWVSAGARLPRGILLDGPPGCGKTLLARAVAGETKASFYTVSASEFVELFVGVGAARVRDMFDTATKNAPAVIFIDELDAVGRRRGSGVGAGHDEREQTLNQLLVCLDGFDKSEQVVVIAATNRSDILDPALLRPGRFDRRITVPQLCRDARRRVLEIHTQGKPTSQHLDLDAIADETEGQSGAQLESLCNEAALLAVRRARRTDHGNVEITEEDFQQAIQPNNEATPIRGHLDTLLIESVTQLASPKHPAIVRVELDDDVTFEGEVLWADAAFIKVRPTDTDQDAVVPKTRIRRIVSLDDDHFVPTDLAVDRWQEAPGLA